MALSWELRPSRSRVPSAWPWHTTSPSVRSARGSSSRTPRAPPRLSPRRPPCSPCVARCVASSARKTSSGTRRPSSAFSSRPRARRRARTTSTSPSGTRSAGVWARAPSTSCSPLRARTSLFVACTSSSASMSISPRGRWRASSRPSCTTRSSPQVAPMPSRASTSWRTSRHSASSATRPRRIPRRASPRTTPWPSSCPVSW
mmetsp:Transcript_46369/g.116620  ORF Transcript_46369/g.116620 Transcript_46369/m.116620 type:complete len:202 (-) Transcript_46369:563-1168(-)